MTAGYEALRAQATGAGAAGTPPRGLSLLLRAGLAAWIAAWRRLVVAPSTLRPPPRTGRSEPAVGLVAELAVVLTEMALGARRRSTS